MKTHIVFLLDETESMTICLSQTISGFNEYIETLRKDPKGCRFTLTKFNSEKVEVVLDGVKLKSVPDLSLENYRPANITPLYDAIGKTINSAEKVKADNTLFVIMTDGEENASKEFTRQMVFDMIKDHDDWTFVFLGADQDAWLASARDLGFSRGNVKSYASRDTQGTMQNLAAATVGYRKSGSEHTESFFEDNDD